MRSLVLLAVSLFCLSIRAGAEESWIKLKTPHFELYTTAGEKKGREAILYFEQVRSFFLERSPSKKAPESPVRIVAFRSEKQFRPYRINEVATAFYSYDANRDYIVMEDIDPEHYPVAIHEYVHLIIRYTGMTVPSWLNEGLAELYSTLKPSGKKAVVGYLIPGRVYEFQRQPLIPLTTLAAVDTESPLYNEKNKAGMFYAESWALTHMLFLGNGYHDHFTDFLNAIVSGKSLSATCQSVLGKSIEEVQRDLQVYFTKGLNGATFPVKLTKSEEDPDATDANGLESSLALADLLTIEKKRAEARSAYDELEKTYPKRPEIDESLGYLFWNEGNVVAASEHFRKALEEGSGDAVMCYRLGMLARASGAREEAVTALSKAVDLKPDYVDARLNLGIALLENNQFKKSFDQLAQIKKVTPEQAPSYFSAYAYDDMRLGQDDDARKNAEQAKHWAKSPHDVEQAENILHYLDLKKQTVAQPAAIAPSTPVSPDDSAGFVRVKPRELLSRAEGVATALACNGKQAVLTIRSDGKSLRFVIPDPDRISIKHAGAATFDFTCGPQKPFHIVVEYVAPQNPVARIDGTVRSLEF